MRYKIIYTLLIYLSPFLQEGVFAQVNLISNPSFEIIPQCPNGFNMIMNASYWFQPYKGVGGQWNSSSDLYSVCSSGLNKVPNNPGGFQYPKTDSSYAGVYFYYKLYREYIENIMLDSLRMNKQYCVTFYVSLSDSSKYAVSNIEAYFSKDSCLHTTPPFMLANPPSVKNMAIISDKINWTKIELQYTAGGGEKFITIGNFDTDSGTDTLFLGNYITHGAYYYIDDVSVIDVSTPAYAGKDTSIALGDSVFIGRPPEIGLNEDCIWFESGNAFDTIAGLWVKPDTTTSYILQQTICGTITYDTVRVHIIGNGIEEFAMGIVAVYPNPSKEELNILLNGKENQEYILKIYNSVGSKILERKVSKQTSINTSGFSKGIYQVNVCNGIHCHTEKVVIQ